MTTPRLDARTWRLASVMVVGAFLSTLEASVVAVGLDTIARDLDVDLDAVAWVTNAYLLALAVSLPACGWLGRRIGVGRLWLGALAGFTVASALCAAAGTLPLLLAARVVQGLAAGLLVPAGQTVIGQLVGPQRLGRVMGVLGLAVSAGPAAGPAIGGLVLQTSSWPWLFAINVPIGLVGLVAGLFVVPRGEAGRAGPLDLVALALVAVGLPATLYALTALGDDGGGTAGLVLAVGIAALAAFVVRTLRVAAPLTDLRLLGRPVFAAACLTGALFGAVMFGSLLVLPLWFQLRVGLDPITTGLSLVSFGVATAVAAPFAGSLADRFGAGRTALVGTALVVVTTVPFVALGPGTPTGLVQTLLVVRGAATAVAALPPTVAAYAAVPATSLPDAATQLNAVNRIGGAAGGALVAVVVARGLGAGPGVAFAAAFTTVAALGLAASAAAARLWVVTRRPT